MASSQFSGNWHHITMDQAREVVLAKGLVARIKALRTVSGINLKDAKFVLEHLGLINS